MKDKYKDCPTSKLNNEVSSSFAEVLFFIIIIIWIIYG
jgi:hypothetical protein